ncbi:MAG: class IV adenylate cyclase [Phycisphaerales bacterium]|nr:class IV adenylate cyclase [Phycisphaerales bacterium]
MAIEHEIKLRCDDLAAIRQRLEGSGGRRLGLVLEHNLMLDTPDGRLRAADCGLRLRRRQTLDGHDAPTVLTFKGPRVLAATAPLKSREEIEVTVEDADTLLALLGRLGFEPRLAYEKRRETWRLGVCAVCLDELPLLGTFVEIEGPAPEAVHATRDALGLAAALSVAKTYVELAWEVGEPGADGVRRLSFELRQR